MNETNEKDNEITSRYTIVMAVAKRARQIIDGSEVLAKSDTDKAVSVAVAEMYEGKLKVVSTATADDAKDNRNYSYNIIEADNLDDTY
ncbi:DNA-directed RNA polymerase subunit omega [Tyzzerella sp. OttesenSCG-928-J15]|nr:DNA-directed RNA polymerase subunit omega [Tyzzerella sp. OttesenSCG-928-J15]